MTTVTEDAATGRRRTGHGNTGRTASGSATVDALRDRPRGGHGPRTRTGVRGLLAATVIAVLALSGCGSSGARDSGAANSNALPPVTQDMDAGVVGGEMAADASVEGAAGEGAAGPGDRTGVTAQVIVSGNASLRVEDPEQALADFTATVTGMGGSIQDSSTSNDPVRPSAQATARVPATRYQELLGQLPDLGEVISSQTSTQDVGQVVADLDARAKALQTSVDRLNELIAEASSTKDLLEAEGQLTSRQAELDSINSQRSYLADQVTMSTLSVDLSARSVVADPDSSVWERSWQAFLGALRGIGVGLVWALPWLAVLALVLVPVALVRRRRRGARAAEVGPGPSGTRGGVPDHAEAVRGDAAATDRDVLADITEPGVEPAEPGVEPAERTDRGPDAP